MDLIEPIFRRVWWALKAAADPRLSWKLIKLQFGSYLTETGWIRSVREETPVDSAGEPVAWLTYPCLRFLEDRLQPEFRIFEYGSGNSTLFFARRVDQVVSVEHDEKWYESVSKRVPVNAYVHLSTDPSGPSYTRAPGQAQGPFDVILVDGRNRAGCLRAAPEWLSPGGVLILDDAERARYASAIAEIQADGFRRLDFWGLAPNIEYEKSTAILYRDDNVVGL